MIDRHRLSVALALCAVLSALASCGRDTNPEPMGAPAPTAYDHAKDADEYQTFMLWLYNQNVPGESGYVYEVALDGWVSVAAGGVVTGSPATWSGGYWFYYLVDPNTMTIDESQLGPDDYNAATGEVRIRMLVPVVDTVFPCEHAAMPILLYPDGVEYANGKAHLGINYHPGLNADCAITDWQFGSVEPVEGTTDFYSRELVTTTNVNQTFAKALRLPVPIDPPIIIEPNLCNMGIAVDIEHHSKWALEEDVGDGPGGFETLYDPCGDGLD